MGVMRTALLEEGSALAPPRNHAGGGTNSPTGLMKPHQSLVLEQALSHLQASGWRPGHPIPQLSSPSPSPSYWTLLPSSPPPFSLRLLGPWGAASARGQHSAKAAPKRAELGPRVVPEEVGVKGAQRETNPIESHQTLQAFALHAPLPEALSPRTVFWPSHPPLKGFSP